MTSHRCLPTGGLILLAVLALAAPAAAAPTVTGATAAPADVKAGAHSDFTVDFSVEGLGAAAGGDDLKSLRLDLPPGLVGNPLATGATCSKEQLTADACPAGTRVGTTTTVADVNVLVLPLNDQSIPGDIYNIPTKGAEAARLGIVLRPAAGLFPKVILESPVSLRSSGDGGLTSTVDAIPRTAATGTGDADLLIKRMTLTLLGLLPSGKAFMTNPTSCKVAPTTITIGTYAGATASAMASFTPTACDALPFAPQLSAKIGSTRDDVRAGAQPAVTVTVTQEAGEANAKSVSVALPGGFGASIAALGNACPVASYDAGTCPAASILGSATANSPLLPAPLTGPVTFVSDPTLGLPQLRVALRGAFAVNLTGVVTLGTTGGLINTFDGIFDVPLSRFVLSLDAGPTSPVKVSRDLCLPGRGTLAGTFVAHSGKTATATAAAELPGCADIRPTTLKARLKKHHVLTLSAANLDRPVRSLGFRLPKGLRFTARATKRARATVSGSGVKAKVRVSKGRLTVTVTGDGATTVDLVLPRGAVRAAGHPTRRLRVDVGLVGVKVKRSTVRLR
ncbi:MAG: hypothetical protein JWM73_461 [Solirubrobacterales bacterium]|nr:hypothetical protein [Solirubrobacterales bacterium]